jgi:hypothetical protein
MHSDGDSATADTRKNIICENEISLKHYSTRVADFALLGMDGGMINTKPMNRFDGSKT